MERRRAARVPMASRGPVEIVGGRLVNVSPFGMLIESPLPMEPDAVHRFRLVIDKEQADVQARVAACAPGGKHRFHVGLEFVGLAESLRSRLADVLKSPETPPAA
jgi:hypothetical protein